MGKSRGSQRTKGNVRPSSSGHSAELLNSSGKLGFVGFSNCKVGQHVAQNSDYKLDGMFTMVMKKMLKRDATTKLKAVQEFRDLCVEKEKETVVEVLAFWPRLYNKLALDFDRRIREATQEANAKLMEKVKRDIAPYLRNIMGVWLLSQSDLYPPAASIAQSTFASTFPKEKQSEALMFCKEEVFLYFKDNLFEQTPQSLSEPNVPTEEVEHKYILVISGTLLGIKLFVNTVSTDAKRAVLEVIKEIVSRNKFWKFAKSKNSQVRAAWYNLISALCHDVPEVFLKLESKLGCAVLGCLSESDASVAPAVWEAALHYVAGFENCWDSIDIHKVVLPELWTLLKGGGSGNASLLFPCLLPFLSKLPVEIIKSKNKFFPQFFSSIIDSLFLESVKKSTAECNAIVSAYIECLQYVCVQLGKGEDWKIDRREIIFIQLLSLVERSFSVEGAHLPVSKFYPLLGTFVQALENIIVSESNIEIQNTYKEELTMFWDKLFLVCEKVLLEEHLPQYADLVFLAYFFHSIYEPSNFLHYKKKCKVRFPDEVPEKYEGSGRSSRILPVLPTQRSGLFLCTVKVCHLLYVKLESHLQPHYMKLLAEILSAAQCHEIFQELLNEIKLPCCQTSDSPRIFFDEIVIPWLHRGSCHNILLENIVDIIFVICSCLESEDALKVLNYSCTAKKPEFLRRMLSRGMAVYEEDTLFCKWLQCPELTQSVTDLFKFVASSVVSDKSHNANSTNLEPFFSTLHAYLVHSASKGILTNIKYAEEILCVILKSLEPLTVQCENLETIHVEVLKFICDTIESILSFNEESWSLSVVDSLMMVLLDMNFNQQLTLTEKLKDKISHLWKLSVGKLSVVQHEFEFESKFVFKAAHKFHNLIINGVKKEISVRFFKCVSTLLTELQRTFVPIEQTCNEDSIISHLMCAVIKEILPTDEEWDQIRKNSKLGLLPAFLEKKLFYPLPVETIGLLPLDGIPLHVTVSQNVSAIIMNCIDNKELSLIKTVTSNVIGEQLFHLLWTFSYCESHDYFRKEDTEEHNIASKLQKNCFKLLAFLSKSEAVTFLHRLCEMSISDAGQWVFPFENALIILEAQHTVDKSVFYDLYLELLNREEPGSELTAQMLIHHLTKEEKIELVLSYVSQFFKSMKLTSEKLNLSSLATVCCCVQEKSVLQFSDVQKALSGLLWEVINVIRLETLPAHTVFVLSTQIYSLLSEMMRNCPDMLSSMWDFTFDFATLAISQCLQRKATICSDVQELIYAYRCCSMICDILFLVTNDNEFLEQIVFKHNPHFMANISSKLLNLFLDISGSCYGMKYFPKPVSNFLATLSTAIELLSPQLLLDAIFSESSAVSQEIIDNALNEKLFPLLISNIFPVQLGAHSVLLKIMPLFPPLLRLEEDVHDEEEKTMKLLSFVVLLDSTTQVVDSILSDIRIGEDCVILPCTDSFTYTLAFLFAWSELLEYFAASTTQERSGIVVYLENNNLLKSFLSCLFRLLPENPSTLCTDLKGSKSKDELKSIFAEPPSLSLSYDPTTLDLQRLACNVFYNTVKKMPAVVRTWCNGLDKRSYDAVNKFTTKYVSGFLAAREIQSVHEHNLQLTNMTIQACPGSREVVAIYTVDGVSIELIIQLPPNFPLGLVNIEKRGNVKINQLKWRQWLMQLTSFLTYQNGSVLDGLLMWKKNLDKTFEGVEECLICFFVLHTTTSELPKRSCPICRKKFHASCIHKWFVTSNNATCPLCRNTW